MEKWADRKLVLLLAIILALADRAGAADLAPIEQRVEKDVGEGGGL